MSYDRKCENWLKTFGEWTLPRSEAPETFIFWTGLYTLAAAIKRRVWIPKRLFGSWECAPNLYVMFIAPAGRARKTTTMGYAEELIDNIPKITRSPELITKEALLSQLVKSDDASMCIFAPEFGEFIVKSGVDMFGFLTNIYDGKKNISASTLIRGGEFVDRPCVNLLGATTPEWVAENMPESVIGGGFASRVIFIFEERVRRRKLYYDDLDFDHLERLKQNLIDDLNHIALNIQGEFKLSDEAKDFSRQYYEDTGEDGFSNSSKLSGYYERKPAHLHKIAMLLHLARDDDLIINKRDFEEAIGILKGIEHKLPKVFESIGKNPYVVDIHKIYEYIAEKGRVNKAQVKRDFMHVATPLLLDELINGLFQAGYVNVEVVENVTFLMDAKRNGHQPKT